MSRAVAAHPGVLAVGAISEQETRKATPDRRQAPPPAAGESMPRLARTWSATTITVLTSMVPDTSQRGALVACGVCVWLGFFGLGWYGPWVAYVTESAPPGRTGFALGLAMSVNQVAVVVVPSALGLLKDRTGSFAPGWGLLAVLTGAAWAVTARGERRARARTTAAEQQVAA
ncbi:hypothetical protein [Streptomyces sp. MST-110588]|uniref:hypothetical protein n=1 Tax=Streptomyces sp. MST-110588 TaxID=2833628 RepID=UPI001F5E1DDB|nr:hypothetical protein [Streptomyces sp. MST-110588]